VVIFVLFTDIIMV